MYFTLFRAICATLIPKNASPSPRKPELENHSHARVSFHRSYFIQRRRMMPKTGQSTRHPSSCHFGSLKMACEGMRSGRGGGHLPALVKALDSGRWWSDNDHGFQVRRVDKHDKIRRLQYRQSTCGPRSRTFHSRSCKK